VLLSHFGTVSLYGILYNTAAIPIMTAAMWLFFAALVCSPVSPPLSGLLVNASEFFLELLVSGSRLCERIPFSELAPGRPTTVHIITGTLLIAGLCAVHKERRTGPRSAAFLL